MKIIKFIAYLLVVLLFVTALEARVWTNIQNTTIEAEIVSATAFDVVINKSGRKFTLKLAELSEADQQYVRTWLSEQTPASTDTPELVLGAMPIRSGVMNQLTLPLNDKLLREAAEFGDTGVTGVFVIIVVPDDFDPAKTYPLLILNNYVQTGSTNIELMNQHAKVATQLGFVLVSTSVLGGEGKSRISDTLRWGMVEATLNEMHEKWPATQEWPVAISGTTYGSKFACSLSAIMMKERYHVIGLFLTDLTSDSPSEALEIYQPTKSKYTRMPIYVSAYSKTRDEPHKYEERAKAELDEAGFSKMKFNYYYERSVKIYGPHLKEALEWFQEEVGPQL